MKRDRFIRKFTDVAPNFVIRDIECVAFWRAGQVRHALRENDIAFWHANLMAGMESGCGMEQGVRVRKTNVF